MNYLFTDALIYTMDVKGASSYNSLLVKEGKIELVGTLSDCFARCNGSEEIINIAGKVILPALTDTHTHFTEYALKQNQLNLSDCSSITELSRKLNEYREKHTVLPEWILGSGWDKNKLDHPAELNSRLIDRVFPDLPVVVYSKDYHSRLCNSLALKIAGISKSSGDPDGGHIFRTAERLPTGILTETAAELIDRYIIQPSDTQVVEALQSAIKEVQRYGLTTVHSMEPYPRADILAGFVQGNHLLRICRHFPLEELDRCIEQGMTSYDGNHWFQLGGVKMFADGSLGSQTAAVFHEYPGSESNAGILRHNEEEMYSIVRRAAQHGISSTVHAIGNRAVRSVINVFQRVNTTFPKQLLLSRIEHLQSISPEDIPRLKISGAYCSMQPVHLANDIDMIERYWAPIRDQTYRFYTLVQQGIPFGFGSDAPIETINPFKGIYSAISRKKGLDPQELSWFSDQRISTQDALHAYTLGAAMGSKSQSHFGSITPGKAADLIVLEDFTKLPNEYWLEARSLLTMLDGRVVFRDGV